MEFPLGDLGPCSVSFGLSALETIRGEVRFIYETRTEPVYDHADGTVPIDEIFLGGRPYLELRLARPSLETLVAALPGAALIGSNLAVDHEAPSSLADQARELRIRRVIDGRPDTDASRSLIIHRAAALPSIEFPYDLEGLRTCFTRFLCFRDDRKEAFWSIGE